MVGDSEFRLRWSQSIGIGFLLLWVLSGKYGRGRELTGSNIMTGLLVLRWLKGETEYEMTCFQEKVVECVYRSSLWVQRIDEGRVLSTVPCLGFPCGSADKASACSMGDLGSIPGLGRSPGEGKGYPLQYSGLENSLGSQRVRHDWVTFTLRVLSGY